MRLECKTTSAKSYRLSLADLEKIRAEAIMGGMEGWAFQVEFQGSPSKRFAIIDWNEYVDLKNAIAGFAAQSSYPVSYSMGVKMGVKAGE